MRIEDEHCDLATKVEQQDEALKMKEREIAKERENVKKARENERKERKKAEKLEALLKQAGINFDN